MTNQEITRLLRNVAAAYQLKGENRFRIIAYENAADAIERSTVEVKDLWKEGKLETLSGIGSSLSSHLSELFTTGNVKHFQQVFQGLPPSLFVLLDVPGLGIKKAFKLVTTLHLPNPDTIIEDLLEAAKKGKIATIESFGEKSQQDIIEALGQYKAGQVKENRMPLPYAAAIADEVVAYLFKKTFIRQALPLGSLRRQVATIGDIDIAVSTDKPKEAIEYFTQFPKRSKIIEVGPSGSTILLTSGRQVDLRVQTPAKFGAMLQYFTGNKHHNIKLREYALKQGLSLNEYGMKPLKKIQSANWRTKLKSQKFNRKEKLYEFDTEEKLYQALGMPWIPPEIREDRGEIEAAFREAQGKQPGLPKLIELKDIRGDLHIHSNYDLEPSHDLGSSSLEDIILNAQRLGYEYIGISDHNPSYTNHSEKQIYSIMKRRKAAFEQIMSSSKITRTHLFIMMEIDILPDGKLALPDDAFEFVDGAIVSIHSSFGMNKNDMTKRILSGLAHPKAKLLAHPTGRLLGKRDGYDVEWRELFQFCKQNNKAVEINSFPERLDLPDGLVKEAIDSGVKLIIDTDSHAVSGMELMRYGVSVARRGWAQKKDILNCLPYTDMKKWLLNK